MKNIILDWYFNTDKFKYGSRVVINSYDKKYNILVGRNKYYRGNSLKEVLIKSTNNYFFKLIFYIFNFELKDNKYFRSCFTGYKNKKNWKKIGDLKHLAWHVGGKKVIENKHITKIIKIK